MKKKIILSIVAVLLVAIIGVTSYFNFIRPLSINVTEVRCENWDATYVGVNAFEEMYNKGEYNKDTTVIHSFNGKLPSDNPKDYMSVYIDIDVKNRNWFQIYSVDGYISNIEKYQDMALYSATMGDVEETNVFRNSNKVGTIVLDLYVGNHTDDEIKEFVKGITINMSGKGDIIGKKKMSIKLADIDNISIER